ncbi:MAG: peptidoglycan-binding protein, partial [Clostridiales bacterium]|nr:peptidoglycan-binding protein [Clostridiales bacterium]
MKKKRGSFLGLIFVLAAIMLIAIIYFNFQADQINRVYKTEAAITPSPTLAPPAIYAKPTDSLLRSGSIGPEVTLLQTRLKELGFYLGELDGQFGNGTKSALVLFQQQHGLEPDGMAGIETMNLIDSSAANKLMVTPKPALPSGKEQLPQLVNRKHAIADN